MIVNCRRHKYIIIDFIEVYYIMKWLNSSEITDARLFALSFGGWLACARVAMKLCKNMGRKMQRKFVDLNSATNVRI